MVQPAADDLSARRLGLLHVHRDDLELIVPVLLIGRPQLGGTGLAGHSPGA